MTHILGRGRTNDSVDDPPYGLRLTPKGVVNEGRYIPTRAATKRALHIWPELWQAFSVADREAATAD